MVSMQKSRGSGRQFRLFLMYKYLRSNVGVSLTIIQHHFLILQLKLHSLCKTL
jgi:hypothetical protein